MTRPIKNSIANWLEAEVCKKRYSGVVRDERSESRFSVGCVCEFEGLLTIQYCVLQCCRELRFQVHETVENIGETGSRKAMIITTKAERSQMPVCNRRSFEAVLDSFSLFIGCFGLITDRLVQKPWQAESRRYIIPNSCAGFPLLRTLMRRLDFWM